MKVLFVDQTGELGGGELCLLDVVRNLPEPSEVALLSDGPFAQLLTEAGIKVTVLSAGTLSGVRRGSSLPGIVRSIPSVLRTRSQLTRLVRQNDLVYANSQKAFIIAALAARNTGRPLVWHLHDILTADHFSSVLRKSAVLLANRYATRIIANSQATKDAFVALGGHRDRVRVIYNGIDSAPFDAVTSSQAQALRQQVAPGAQFLVGVFGRLSPWKGQHVLIESLQSLPDVHALIVGEALFGEADYAQRLQGQASHPELRNRVHFLGFRDDIPALMKAVDVVVHTSTSPEPFGRVVVEGMLAGRPVIASKAGGILEIIHDQDTGLTIEPGQPAALAQAVASLRQDPGFASRIAAAGRESALTLFTLDVMIRGVQEVITESLQH